MCKKGEIAKICVVLGLAGDYFAKEVFSHPSLLYTSLWDMSFSMIYDLNIIVRKSTSKIKHFLFTMIY